MPRAAIDELPPVLQHGFRPFFLLGALWAVLAVGLWLLVLAGRLVLPTGLDPLAWHRHEMLFGHLGAIVAAFLLTAIPNWTGRLPVHGPRLLALVLLWLAARLALLTGAWIGPWPGCVLDVGFLAGFTILAGREILAGRSWRNLPVVMLLGLLTLAALLSQLEASGTPGLDGLGDRLAMAVIAMMVALIGGRIISSFTTNWLKARAATTLPAGFGRLDRAVLLLTALALVAWVVAPAGLAAGLLLPLAALGTALRLVRWQGWRTAAEPLLLILHLGHAWLAVSVALIGLGVLGRVPEAGAVHALTTGTFGTMVLAVMTRATLGHTGRALTADRWTVAIYVLVTLGAAMRVLAGLVPPGAYVSALHLAGGAWGGAFLLFLVRYGPILLAPRQRPVASGRASG